MAKPNESYQYVIVESYRAENTSGLHGEIHIRPAPDQGFSPNLRVECSKSLSRDYRPGTRFRIRAKLTDRKGEGAFLYSSFHWPFEVLS